MNIFGIGLPELAVIAAIALLVFGPKRLPEMGRSLGRTLRGFQSASQEFEKAFRDGLQPEEVQANSPLVSSGTDATTATTAAVASPDPQLGSESS
jgi:sec-independent protein translocase protein TatA